MKMDTVQQTLKHWADSTPDTTACCFAVNGVTYTYRQLFALCNSYQAWFAGHGVYPGDTVCLALGNSQAAAEVLYAAYYHGILVVALNLASGAKAKQYVLEHSAPKRVFTDLAESQELLKINPDLALILLDKNTSPVTLHQTLDVEQAADANQPSEAVQPAADNPALLMYTSGTTGTPKGVLLSQKNLIAGGYNTVLAHELKPSDIGLCVLPLYHINAQCVSVMAALVSGSSVVISNQFSVKNFFSTVAQYTVTWCSLVPTMVCYLLNWLQTDNQAVRDSCLSLQFIRSASAPLPVEVHRQFEALIGVPIIETMGITETAAQILSNPRPPAQRKIGTVGTAYGNQVAIYDKHHKSVPVGSVGEVVIKGDNVMQGYYRDAQTTQQSFTQDGWFLSGDLGYIDEQGYVTICGRKKELIIKGGENISPREIDEVLYSRPEVLEAAAFAVPSPHYGQTVIACVALDESATLSESALLALCRERLGDFKCPDAIHVLPSLPKGPSGKIQRLKLAEQLGYSD